MAKRLNALIDEKSMVKIKYQHIRSWLSEIGMLEMVEYLSVVNGIPLTRTKAADFSQKNIVGFMEWLLNSRNNIATTANQRLTHLRGFCKYLRKNNLISFVEYEEICEIGEIADPL